LQRLKYTTAQSAPTYAAENQPITAKINAAGLMPVRGAKHKNNALFANSIEVLYLICL